MRRNERALLSHMRHTQAVTGQPWSPGILTPLYQFRALDRLEARGRVQSVPGGYAT